jgi:hypothetical protein
MRKLSLLILAVTVATADAQTPAFDLSVKNIMRGPELYGREPSQVRWTADGAWVYFRWLEPGAAWDENLKPYRIAPRAGAQPEMVTDAHMDSVAPMLASGPRSRDGRMRVVTAGGDVWLHQISGARVTLRRITETLDNESGARFSLDSFCTRAPGNALRNAGA